MANRSELAVTSPPQKSSIPDIHYHAVAAHTSSSGQKVMDLPPCQCILYRTVIVTSMTAVLIRSIPHIGGGDFNGTRPEAQYVNILIQLVQQPPERSLAEAIFPGYQQRCGSVACWPRSRGVEVSTVLLDINLRIL
ncbi:hypothetical protein J6590_043563 [Homalodisca vitripennis]|nr:hypothetical protein J6590_043563 [Homalodisca vitripennis]